ncbi:DNA polymerase [Roseateles sp. YR242]|uniref:uracil-DNA glycosylase n=1 Tax=Roseateles sp. YR242 TaxID=1855305 RepID=UPI0008CBEF79|nr:uracil-DNA glycosylase [Roseateles sp. YR242]SEL49683.1 DNA polymerase [Roseateles sp. YR242]
MTWSERQRLMLEAMGLKIWVPQGERTTAPAATLAPPASTTTTHAAAADQAGAAVMTPERPRAPPAQPRVPAPSPAVAAAEPAAPRRVAEVLARVLPGTGAAPEGDAPRRPGLAREAIAALDWDGLRGAVAGCQACGLCESRKNTVFGVGNPNAHWMIVGEAPGEQEDLQGEPFVGNAGKLLDNMLRALGLSREEGPPEQQVYIANTLKCRPPRNRNPDPAELAQCEPFLQRQIELIQPRIILAMGRFAVQQLLQSQDAIGRLRGRVHRYQGVPLVVTYHPAYLLRNLPDKARAWEDLCLARKTLETAA